MNFLYGHWTDLLLSTRNKIAEVFGINKVRSTHVVDNHVQDDGYDIKDIEAALTLQRLQEYLGTDETDITILWVLLINKIEGREIPKTIVTTDDYIGLPKVNPPITSQEIPPKEPIPPLPTETASVTPVEPVKEKHENKKRKQKQRRTRGRNKA